MANDDVPDIPEIPRLSPDQFQAINLILAGKSYTDVAEVLGKERKTLYRWRQNPHFLTEINRRRKEIYEAGQTRLQGLLHKAISVIEQKLDEEKSLKAAMEVLRLLNITPKTMKADYEDDPEKIAAKEAEKMAIDALSTTPFGQENMAIGAHRNREVQDLANDIYELMREKYQITTALEELAE